MIDGAEIIYFERQEKYVEKQISDDLGISVSQTLIEHCFVSFG